MALPGGLRLGPYEIRALLGAGGMGEVYEATDTRLDRVVALKVVRAELAGDADRRARFLREARAIAGLTHPHICPLYDVGEAQIPGSPHPVDFLVMERLTGQNLAERLAAGPMPLGEVIAHAQQIASALDHAHRQGIVHRDLKPANIMLTPSGARLLDFGLAQLRADTPRVMDPTRTSLTAEGTVLGTIQYCAPEQLEGRAVDQRADLFAFGAILYEMVTGQRAFEGGSPAAIISAILGGPVPRLRDAAPLSPPALDRIVATSLARNPEERWFSAHDVGLLLRQLDDTVLPAPAASPRARAISWAGWVVAALAIAAAATIAMRDGRTDQAAERDVFSIVPPADVTITQGETPQLSPDGRQIAIVGTDASGRTRIYVRGREAHTWRPLEETDDATLPFWKPDGQAIGYFGGSWLWTVSTGGGRPQRLAPAGVARGGTWNQRGQILYVPSPNAAPHLISESGGTPSPVPVESDATPIRWFPHFLPDGRHYLHLTISADRKGRVIRVGSIETTDTRELVESYASATYAPSGHLLYRRDESLVARPFDAGQQSFTGPPAVVAERVAYNPISYQALFSTSADGRLAYVGEEQGWQLSWFDADGRETRLPPSAGGHSSVCLSADGTRALFDVADSRTGAVDIWSLSLADNTAAPLTFDPAVDFSVVCAPQGDEFVFSSLRAGVPRVYRASARTPGAETLLRPADEPTLATDWSRDNRLLVLSVLAPAAKTGWDIWVMPLAGGEPSPYLRTEANERLARLAPDGRWMAYLMSDTSGQEDVYISPFPAASGLWRISRDGARQLAWHPNGDQLFYVSRDLKLMAVDLTISGTTLGDVPPARVIAETRAGGFQRGTIPMAVDRGGRVLLGTAREGVQPVTVVLNWQSPSEGRE